jgi:hypothetical protein
VRKIILGGAALALAFSLMAVAARAEIRSLEMSVFGMD